MTTSPESCPCKTAATRESAMVVLRRDDSGRATVWCDPCIAPIVAALNDAGLSTVASCCGHGYRPGVITLKDERHLMIVDEAGRVAVDQLFPRDVNGEDRGVSLLDQLAAAQAECERLNKIVERAHQSWGNAEVSYQEGCAVVNTLHCQLDDALSKLDPLLIGNHRLESDLDATRTQLAAVTAARDEACNIAESRSHGGMPAADVVRISSLRKAGGGR